MNKKAILTPRQAAGLINDGDTISVNSSSGLGCPDAVLKGIGERYSETSSPSGLTTIHPIAAGDMWGIKGMTTWHAPGSSAGSLQAPIHPAPRAQNRRSSGK